MEDGGNEDMAICLLRQWKGEKGGEVSTSVVVDALNI